MRKSLSKVKPTQLATISDMRTRQASARDMGTSAYCWIVADTKSKFEARANVNAQTPCSNNPRIAGTPARRRRARKHASLRTDSQVKSGGTISPKRALAQA